MSRTAGRSPCALGDSGFQFSKETWNKLFTFSTAFSSDDRTLRVFGQFTQLGEKELSDQAHTLEVYCQIPPLYGTEENRVRSFRSTFHCARIGRQLLGQ